MTFYDNHVLMTLKLDRWSQDHSLRAYEIERELAAQRAPQPVRRRRKFLLAPFWRRSVA